MGLRVIKNYLRFILEPGFLKTIREHHLDGLGTMFLFWDVLFCKIRYGILTKEFFFFSFYDKSHHARSQYVGTRERNTKLRAINTEEAKQVLRSKIKTYEAFHDFFRRDVVLLEMPKDSSLLSALLDKKENVIGKPVSSTQGKGIVVLHKGEDCQINPNSLNGEYVFEDLIKQDSLMACFHPHSVNTIRYVTFYNGKKIRRLFALIRMGVGKSIIDNTCAGGISAAVDLESGIIITEAASQNGNRYCFHPDTGTQIIGAQIPRWKELNDMVEKMDLKYSSMKVVGWDCALCEDGWCLVEANSLPSFFGIQIALNKGCRPLLNTVLKQD